MTMGVRNFGLSLLTALAVAGFAGQAQAAAGERFEVTSIKALRPLLTSTVAALQKHDVKAAKEAFDSYDSAWTGIEVYISTRDKTMYGELEQNLQAKLDKELAAPMPDAAAILPDAQAMLKKYDEAIDMVSKAKPLNPLYDDVARLRIERAPLREVTAALKAGDVAKARKAYTMFDDDWDNIEDLIKARSQDAYVAIEKNMIQIEAALKPAKPDVDKVTTLVAGISDQYNPIVQQITKEAQGR